MPNLQGVLSQLRSIDFVGISDFFHESLCLLKLSTWDLAPHDRTCMCQLEHVPARAEAHNTHNTHSPRLPTDPELLHLVDRLTQVDRAMFEAALQLFFRRLVSLERRLGFRVVCPPRVSEVQAKLPYINVSSIYWNEYYRSSLVSDV